MNVKSPGFSLDLDPDVDWTDRCFHCALVQERDNVLKPHPDRFLGSAPFSSVDEDDWTTGAFGGRRPSVTGRKANFYLLFAHGRFHGVYSCYSKKRAST